jgi:signal transduction histidine kinase
LSASTAVLDEAPPSRHAASHHHHRPASSAARLLLTQERLRALAYELTVAEARERERIANGLHDDIGQMLAMLRYKLSLLGQAFPADSAASALLGEAHALLREATAATRSATFELCNPVLRELGFRSAVESVAQQAARTAGIPVAIEGDLPPLCVPEPVLSVLLRVVRELLFNVQKHARARCATVRLACTPHGLTLHVADDGRGFVAGSGRGRCGPKGGYGLVSAEAQMQAVGGALEIRSTPGLGTCATLTLPLPPGQVLERVRPEGGA